MKVIAVLLLTLLWGCMTPPPPPRVVEGYSHHGDPVTVKIRVWANERVAPYERGEYVHFTRVVSRGEKFRDARDFILTEEYARATVAMKIKQLSLPDMDLVAPTAVFRGADRKPIVRSGRGLLWPEGFQLRDGDVIEIYEVID